MDYENFKEQFVNDVKEKLYEQGTEVDISVNTVNKLNESYEALTIKPVDAEVGVNIPIDKFYGAVDNGASYDEVVDRAVKTYTEGIENRPDFDIAALSDYNQMKDKLAMEVVSAETNKELLETVPHKDMEDMAVVYRFVISSDEEGRASVLITNKMLENYGVTPEQLHADALVNAQKEARKIINDAKQQSKEMVDGAKSEQMRLAEQSAAECERIVTEHKEKCAQLIRDNTAVTEKKINTIRAAYEDELARYKQLQADVTYFKANLIELYKEQIQLVMDLPTMTEEELDEYESSFDENGNYVPKEAEPAVSKPAEEEKAAAPVADNTANAAAETEAARVDKILNTGSFEPVIPKSTLNDLQFGKNN